jgi:hypothetical protein
VWSFATGSTISQDQNCVFLKFCKTSLRSGLISRSRTIGSVDFLFRSVYVGLRRSLKNALGIAASCRVEDWSARSYFPKSVPWEPCATLVEPDDWSAGKSHKGSSWNRPSEPLHYMLLQILPQFLNGHAGYSSCDGNLQHFSNFIKMENSLSRQRCSGTETSLV